MCAEICLDLLEASLIGWVNPKPSVMLANPTANKPRVWGMRANMVSAAFLVSATCSLCRVWLSLREPLVS